MLTCDWTSLMTQQQKYGPHIHESRLPGQTYFEAYKEKLADGLSYPETQVISVAEENKQNALKPEASRQMRLHLDNTLAHQTKRRSPSSMPDTIEQLRNKYQAMSHLWLLALMRQPTRPLHADLKENTFTKFLDELLSEKIFLLERDIASSRMIVPIWTHCLEYEFQLRKKHSSLRAKQDNLLKQRSAPRIATLTTGSSTG